MIRVGLGIDTHRFSGKGDHVVLCGVKIPCFSGVEAHSDGDVAAHAVMDALLGAVALGDIGQHFPPTDEAFKDSNSLSLLEKVMGLLKEKGYGVHNVDMTIVAEKPKILIHASEMRRNIAAVLGVSEQCVSVKATTAEKMGALGRCEGIAVHAIAAVYPLKELQR